MILSWLFGTHQPDYIQGWNAHRVDLAWQATERMLLGHAGPARVTGNRVVERREAQVQARRLPGEPLRPDDPGCRDTHPVEPFSKSEVKP